MAAAYFCARAGVPVTLFEKADALGGIVRQVIPDFRISGEAIGKDAALLDKLGVDVRLNTPAPSVEELKKQGYTHILLAIGAWKPGALDIPGNVRPVISWMRDVKAGKAAPLGHATLVRKPGRPAAPTSTPYADRASRSTNSPTAERTVSQGMETISPVSTGERRPEASGSPRRIFLQRSIPSLCSTGAASSRNAAPSARASSSSSASAGMYFLVRR